MDKKLYNTWMTITALVLGIIGLAFILVSIFDSGAGSSVLIIGLLGCNRTGRTRRDNLCLSIGLKFMLFVRLKLK